jgi:hypothetical protein
MLYIKFKPYNEHTLASLINKTLHFSTVFDFNDLNEYRLFFTSSFLNDDQRQLLITKLNEKIYDTSFRQKTWQFAQEMCSEGGIQSIDNWLKGKNNLNEIASTTLEMFASCLAYSTVGIFSVAALDIFDDKTAPLMFAHYASNLAGLGLVYEIPENKNIYSVRYCLERGKHTGVHWEEFLKWEKGEFQCMKNRFLLKHPAWEYEKEWRVFGKPGTHHAEDHDIQLKACIYTSRLGRDAETTLNKLNEQIYQGNLKLFKVYMPIHKTGAFYHQEEALHKAFLESEIQRD